MSKCIYIMLILVVLLSFTYASNAKHNSNSEIPAKSVGKGETFNDHSKQRGHRPGNVGNHADSHAVPNRKKKVKPMKEKKFVLKTRKGAYDNINMLSRLESLKDRISSAFERATERLYNKFFNYTQYQLEKEQNGRENEFLDKAILGIIFSITVLIGQIIHHGFKVCYHKYSWIFNFWRRTTTN